MSGSFDVTNGTPEFAVTDPTNDAVITGAAALITATGATSLGELFFAIQGGGVPGVDLIGLDVDNVTLSVTNNGVTDTIVVDGLLPFLQIGEEAIDFGNFDAEFRTVFEGDADALFSGDVGAVIEDVLTGDGVLGVTLIGVDQDNVSLAVALAGTIDTLVIDQIQDIIAGIAETVGFANRDNEFGVADLADSDVISSGGAAAISGEFRDIVGGQFVASEVSDLLFELLLGDGVDGVDVVDLDDDTLTLSLTNSFGVADILVIDNAADEITQVC